MKALLAIALLVAAQAAAEDNPAEAPQTQAKDQPPDAHQPPATKEEAGDPGLTSEIDRLRQIQEQIRALLKSEQISGQPQDTSRHEDKPDQADDSAEASAPEAQQQPPEMVDVMAAANALYLTGEYEGALALYDKAAGGDNNDTCWAIFQKANCLRWLGRVEDAGNAYQQLVTENPDNRWAREAVWWIAAIEWKRDHAED
ncbi:MAG: tetratricopeptide repeat protein [Planctomycetes bacterium]|nr:tetratricopeptide repeat protein [Planctomycetota bacterium]